MNHRKSLADELRERDIKFHRTKDSSPNGQGTANAAESEPAPAVAGKAVEATVKPWPDPQPIPNDLPPVMPFVYALLPEAFVTFVTDVAERMQCPPDFAAVAIMVVLAGVVGKKIGIRPKRHDDWLVIANLWGAVIGRPGIMKTPAIRQFFRFLHRLEIEAREEYQKALEEYEIKLLVAKQQKKQREKAIAQAVKKGEDPEAAAQGSVVEDPKEPTPRRYLINDSTVEKLGELLNQNHFGLTVFRDEVVGLLKQLDKQGQECARAFYLEAWDGLGTFTYDRIGRGTIYISCVTLSLFGGMTPGRLVDYLGAALQGGAGDDGLLQRFQMMVNPDIDKQWKNVDRWPNTEAKQRTWEVLQRLDGLDPQTIGAEKDKDDDETPLKDKDDDETPFLRFDQEAQSLFDDWRAKLEERLRSGDLHPALESHLAKYRSLIPSLALLIHLADDGRGCVKASSLRKALAWAAYLESHAIRIYAIVTNPAAIAAKALAKRIEKGELKDGFSLRDIYRKHWTGLCQKEAVEMGVDLLLELGWLKDRVEDTGGKPKVTYLINPSLSEKTGTEASAKTDKRVVEPPSGTSVTAPSGHLDDEWGEA